MAIKAELDAIDLKILRELQRTGGSPMSICPSGSGFPRRPA
jgi:DNA-binding Lrp family transcriptional regulator